MAKRGPEYWAAHELELRSAGLDPDEDDDWARPDNEVPELEPEL